MIDICIWILFEQYCVFFKSAVNWSLIKREPHCIIAAGLDFLKASQIWSLSFLFLPINKLSSKFPILLIHHISYIFSQKLPNMFPFFFQTPKYFVQIFHFFVSFIWRIFGSLVVSLRNASHGDEIKRSRWACSKLAPGPTG